LSLVFPLVEERGWEEGGEGRSSPMLEWSLVLSPVEEREGRSSPMLEWSGWVWGDLLFAVGIRGFGGSGVVEKPGLILGLGGGDLYALRPIELRLKAVVGDPRWN